MATTTTNIIDSLITRTKAGFYSATYFARPNGLADYITVSGDTVNVPLENAIVEASTQAAGVASTDLTAYSPSTKSIALSKIGMVAEATYEQIADVNNGDNLANRLSSRIVQGIAQKADKDVFAVLDGTSNSTTTTAKLNAGDIYLAAAKLRKANAKGALVAFISPEQAYDLKVQLGNLESTNIPALSTLGNDVLNGSFVARIGEVSVYMTNLNTNTNAVVYCVDGLSVGVKSEGILVESKKDEAKQTWDFFATLRIKSVLTVPAFAEKVITTVTSF